MPHIPMIVRLADLGTRVAGTHIADLDEAGIVRVRGAGVDLPHWAHRLTGVVDPRVRTVDEQVSTRSGTVRVRWYVPPTDEPAADETPQDSAGETTGAAPWPVLMFFHGGGFALGSVESYTPLCSYLAGAAGVLVGSVDYRRSPEHRAPAAVHDCVDATRAVPDVAPRLGGDPTRIAVAGDSAGGNLAAVVAQVLRDEGGPRLRHQALLYPLVDHACLRRSRIRFAEGPILPRRDLEAFFSHYVGDGPDALHPTDPLVSPLYGRLDGLPPALVQTAQLDPLRDEGMAYARALQDAGVDVVVTEYLGAPHGFANWPGGIRGAMAHRDEMVAQLRRYLAPA